MSIYDRDDEKPDTSVQDLLTYLGHCNKPDYVATVVSLIRQSQAGEVKKLQRTIQDTMSERNYDTRGFMPGAPQTIQLPANVRKVHYEF